MNGRTSAVMHEWYSDEWCTDHHATSQERLQEIAMQIGKNCRITKIVDTGWNGQICTVYENEALSIRYWVHDTFGHISTITEARYK